MIKKLMTLLFSLFLIGIFYVFAVMREPDAQKFAEIAAPVSLPLESIAQIDTVDPEGLAQGMGCAIPLPRQIVKGEVRNASFQAQPVRLLEIQGKDLRILGVRPACAIAMLRAKSAHPLETAPSWMGYPTVFEKKAEALCYYLSTEDAAFQIQFPAMDQEQALSLLASLQMSSP